MLIQAPKPLRAYLKHLFKITTHKIEQVSVLVLSFKKALCLAPYIRPLIFGFSNKVSGTGGRMFNA